MVYDKLQTLKTYQENEHMESEDTTPLYKAYLEEKRKIKGEKEP